MLFLIFADPPFYFNMIFADPPPPPNPTLSSGMHETKSMCLSSQHVQLIDILFKVTLNLDLSCSSPRPCVDYCRIDINVLGALDHFFFFSRLPFLFRFFVLINSKQGNFLQGTTTQKPLIKTYGQTYKS